MTSITNTHQKPRRRRPRSLEGRVFSIEGDRRDFQIEQAALVGEPGARHLSASGAEPGESFEVDGTEHGAGNFEARFAPPGGAPSGRASLTLFTRSDDALALVGDFHVAGDDAQRGPWAFLLRGPRERMFGTAFSVVSSAHDFEVSSGRVVGECGRRRIELTGRDWGAAFTMSVTEESPDRLRGVVQYGGSHGPRGEVRFDLFERGDDLFLFGEYSMPGSTGLYAIELFFADEDE